jgi:hypothetical protein
MAEGASARMRCSGFIAMVLRGGRDNLRCMVWVVCFRDVCAGPWGPMGCCMQLVCMQPFKDSRRVPCP